MASAGGAVRQIRVVFAGDTKDLDKAAKNGEQQMGRWQAGFKKMNKAAVAGSLAIVAGFGKIAKDSVGLSRHMSDLDAKSRAVFEDQLKPMQKWAKENKKAFGLSSRETLGLAANFADLLKPMGFTAEEAANMSTEVLDLSGALAKWSNGQYEASEVSEILSKAMLGEREQLKSLGISISEADVKQRLAKNGTDELTGAALQQARAIATQQLIMEKSTDAQAAWANGGRAAAEAENSMSVATAELQEKIATVLAPAIAQGTELLAGFADWVEENDELAIKLGKTVLALAGFVLGANAAYKAYRATMIAVAVATKGLTVAQKALNLAMRANPLGLVVTALVAIGGALVTAYQKSETFRRIVDGAFARVKGAGQTLLNFFLSIPGALSSAGSAVFNALTWPYRTAFNKIKGWWNSSVGGFGFDIPHWVPKVGGNSWRIPYMHTGGVFDAGAGRTEGLAMLKDGETVRTEAQEAALGQPITVTIPIQIGDEVVRVVKQVIRVDRDELARSMTAGSGAMFGAAA